MYDVSIWVALEFQNQGFTFVVEVKEFGKISDFMVK